MEPTQTLYYEETFSAVRDKILSWKDEDIDEVEIRLDWNLPDILELDSSRGAYNTPPDMWSPTTQVVVVKDSAAPDNFMATTYEEYLKEHWDSVCSRNLLRMLDQFLNRYSEFVSAMRRGADLVENVTAAEKVVREAKDVLPATDARAEANTQLKPGKPKPRTEPLGVHISPMGLITRGNSLTGRGVKSMVEAADRNQRDSFAERIVLAEERASTKKAELERALAEEPKFEIPHIDGASVDLSRSMVILHFRSYSDLKRAIDYIEAWDWFCRAACLPERKEIKISMAFYRVCLERNETSKKLLRITSSLRSARSHEMKHGCWEVLFRSCTLAVGSLKPRLGFGKGLELSLDLMVSLAAVEYCLIIAGGVVFIGYRTVLFPTAIQGNCAQFHLITTNKGQINPYTLEYGSRVLTENVIQFKNMRCFLGWCANAQVNLGSKMLPTTVTYSGGLDKGHSIKLDGFSALVQAGASSPLSAILGLQSNFKYVSHVLRFTPSGCYTQLLQDTAKEVAMVYDAPQRRCWVVPKLSLLLHMSQVYASQCVNVSEDQVPSVAPHSDTPDLVRSLKWFGETRILGDGEDAFRFRHLMLGLNTNLLRAIALTQDSTRKKLYGFEFMDIINQPGRGSCMKELKTELAAKGWFDIANVVDAVVVCANLGDAITAVDENGVQSRECSKIPCGSNYLAATICCLKELIERRGGVLNGEVKAQLLQISENSFWDLAKNPFSACHHEVSSGACWQRADMFQHLVSRWDQRMRNLFKRPPAPTVIPVPPSGAVVFGTT